MVVKVVGLFNFCTILLHGTKGFDYVCVRETNLNN
jgi:hypothetical protein